jgi:hypothetical protein
VSTARLRITVWATTLGADLATLCRFLDSRDDVDLTVFMRDPEAYKRQAAWHAHPLRSPVVGRNPLAYPRAIARGADVTIVDNAVPLLKTSRTIFVLWHGFGWKGPDDRDAFAFMRRCITRWWGDPTRPNPRVCWQCFGEWDRRFRHEVSGFSDQILQVLGSACHDDVVRPLDRERMQAFYPFDIVNRRTALLAPTWHYNGVFAHWGPEPEVFEPLMSLLERHAVNLILRMHDRWRYERRVLEQIGRLGRRYPHMLVKFKNEDQDNTIDLRLADLLITNFSSIANCFYATGRPTIHVYPVSDADQPFALRQVWGGLVRRKRIANVRAMWKLPPEENGGLVSTSLAEFLSHVELALNDPGCCRERSRRFIDTYMPGADGRNCERIFAALQALAR